MTDNHKGIWITTTTGFGFDIFHFANYLQTASLLELHTRLVAVEEEILIEEALYELTYGELQDAAAKRLQFYNDVHHAISMEIGDRTLAAFKPQALN